MNMDNRPLGTKHTPCQEYYIIHLGIMKMIICLLLHSQWSYLEL
jgi:hypothetical protein